MIKRYHNSILNTILLILSLLVITTPTANKVSAQNSTLGISSNPPISLESNNGWSVFLPVAVSQNIQSHNYFTTLPPGSALPGDAECAAKVRPQPENKRMNVVPNATVGNQHLASDIFGKNSPANASIAARVTGNYTGTTDMILQWAACKWGIDEDMVRAQAVDESTWRQNAKGVWTTDESLCPPGHGLGVDGTPGQCPQAWGILQVSYIYMTSAWPSVANSTAFNVDTTYAYWRACYEGYLTWLNNVDRGGQYTAGDAWGCLGVWYAGRWKTQPALDYISRVKNFLDNRTWEVSWFQEP